MRRFTILTAALALSAGIAMSASPAQAREVLAFGQGWNMPQDLARMDAPARPLGYTTPLTISEQRARRAAMQRSLNRNFSGLATRGR